MHDDTQIVRELYFLYVTFHFYTSEKEIQERGVL